MSTRKTKVDLLVVKKFLESYHHQEVTDLEFIKGGELSQAFFYTADESDYVIRIDSSERGYLRDKYAYTNFKDSGVPIPKFVHMGKFSESLWFAITKKVKGNIMDELSRQEFLSTRESLFEVLHKIHQIDVTTTKGFGGVETDGVGRYKSWENFITVSTQKSLKSLAASKPQDIETFELAHNQIFRLLKHAPVEKSLIHGDYGFNNVLAYNSKISGVIDWAEFKYGDFMYDIAWLDYWSSEKYGNAALGYYKKINKTVDHFNERLWCYKLFIGLTSLRFFLRTGQDKTYEGQVHRVLSLANTSKLLIK